MKKMFLFIIVIIMVPCMITLGFSLIFDEVGIGNHILKNHYMGKEILVEMNGLYKSLDVEEYVLGVLAGTISPDYDMETLKVQAILIRTNLLKEMQEKNTEDAKDLSYHYLPKEECIQLWGERNYESNRRRMQEAVMKTSGKVIKQENQLIMAMYHEVSIGCTASGMEILGADIPYLQSVDSSRDVEAKHYMDIIFYSPEELIKIVEGMNSKKEMMVDDQENNQDGVEQENAKKIEKVEVKIMESTENGFVKKIMVNQTTYSGEEAMKIFQLPSTNFYIEKMEKGIRFVCLGKGSCLGVSQYGANRMAKDGKSMEEIINYYYKKVTIVDDRK